MIERISTYGPDYFIDRMDNGDSSTRPPIVIKRTASIINNYFSGLVLDAKYIEPYLTSDTMNFLRRAYNGFQYTAALAHNKNVEYLSSLDQNDRSYASDSNDEALLDNIEAFNTTHIIFGNIPRRYSRDFLPNGFSTTGMLRSPSTLSEFGRRTIELMHGIHEIVQLSTATREPTMGELPALRMHAFFNVGSELPFKETNTKHDHKDILGYLKKYGKLPEVA